MSKLSYEDKIYLYNDRKKEMTILSLCSKYNINHSLVEYMIRLIDKHGIIILRTTSNKKYTTDEKELIINRILKNEEIINKRKYYSYKETIGKIADNHINKDFYAEKPNQKWYTDVIEFNLRGEKCYLSPILDSYNGKVISHNISKSPNLEQVNNMLNKAFNKNNKLDGLIIHSDQEWQYQHQAYQQKLENHGIIQSMSRKGNSMDNGMVENFFGLLKTEMSYDQEDKYKDIDELIIAIDDYINYDRIKVKLKGLSPVNYRLQSSNQFMKHIFIYLYLLKKEANHQNQNYQLIN